MEAGELAGQVLETWRRHNEILLLLLAAVPPKGMKALPAGSRGRTVALQFAHLDRVRRGWLEYFATAKRPKMPRADKGRPPTKAQLRKTLNDSAKRVAVFLRDSMHAGAKPRMFAGHAIRWMGYLIAHESHHRGQIMLALKQSGIRLPEKVAMDGLWGRWFWGK
jgi:uncharacterized damage-inducible protein DinB